MRKMTEKEFNVPVDDIGVDGAYFWYTELIRCKDCKHRDPEDKKCDCGHSIRWQLPRSDEWFCADAERRGMKNERIYRTRM